MGDHEPNLSVENFSYEIIDDIIRMAKRRDCSLYCSQFIIANRTAESPFQSEIIELFIQITLCHPDFTNYSNPFKQLNLSPDQFAFILGIYELITDFELKSRVADILWVFCKEYKAANSAIIAYIESSIILENPNEWPLCYERIKRAYQLSLCLGKKNRMMQYVIDHIVKTIDKYNGGDPLYLSCVLMELIIDVYDEDVTRFIDISNTCALRAEYENDYRRANSYWSIQAKLFNKMGLMEDRKTSLIKAAETNVKEAEKAICEPSRGYLAAAHFMQYAIIAYRQIPNNSARVDQLKVILNKYQERTISELQSIEVPIDLSQESEAAIKHVAGKPVFDALFSLAFITRPANKSNLKIMAETHIKEHPLSWLFPSKRINQWGRVVAIQPSAISEDEDEVNQAIRAEMNSLNCLQQSIVTQGVILPALKHICSKNTITKETFVKALTENRFVPEGRKRIFAEGLSAGANLDLLTSTHLLIPQIENSIRHILYELGLIVSGNDDNGIQNENDLNTLLYRNEVEDIFGEDLTFDLQCLLVDRFGSNLRNRLAHGLLEDTDFDSTICLYLWWTSLRLCFMPLLIESHSSEKKMNSENTTETI